MIPRNLHSYDSGRGVVRSGHRKEDATLNVRNIFEEVSNSEKLSVKGFKGTLLFIIYSVHGKDII